MIMDAKETSVQPTFEEKMAVLERLLSDMEGGSLSLDESVKMYENGAKMLSEMRKELDCAEQRLTIIREGREEKFELAGEPSEES